MDETQLAVASLIGAVLQGGQGLRDGGRVILRGARRGPREGCDGQRAEKRPRRRSGRQPRAAARRRGTGQPAGRAGENGRSTLRRTCRSTKPIRRRSEIPHPPPEPTARRHPAATRPAGPPRVGVALPPPAHPQLGLRGQNRSDRAPGFASFDPHREAFEWAFSPPTARVPSYSVTKSAGFLDRFGRSVTRAGLFDAATGRLIREVPELKAPDDSAFFTSFGPDLRFAARTEAYEPRIRATAGGRWPDRTAHPVPGPSVEPGDGRTVRDPVLDLEVQSLAHGPRPAATASVISPVISDEGAPDRSGGAAASTWTRYARSSVRATTTNRGCRVDQSGHDHRRSRIHRGTSER